MGKPKVLMLGDGICRLGMQSQVEKGKKRQQAVGNGDVLYLRRAAVAGGISCAADSGQNALVRFWRGRGAHFSLFTSGKTVLLENWGHWKMQAKPLPKGCGFHGLFSS